MEHITLTTVIHEYYNDLCDIIRLFTGACTIDEEAGGMPISHTIEQGQHVIRAPEVEVRTPLTPEMGDELENKRVRKRAIKNALYDAMKQITGRKPPWGSLTGVRPTRLLYEQMMEGHDETQACKNMEDIFDVDPDKMMLLRDIIRIQNTMGAPKQNDLDVYVGIPFCRTRCSFCSFAATDLKHGGQLTGPYVEALIREMMLLKDDLSSHKMRGLYIGGGTPTALTHDELSRVIDAALECFPGAKEFTVEAGRPDTIDQQMLTMLKSKGVDRISINPQSMNDETLRRIGRDHTAQDIRRVYEMMREMDFGVINMDLIMALPGETIDDVKRTLEEVAKLAPDNLTVHTLAIKRTAALHDQGYTADEHVAQAMVTLAAQAARDMGLMPYYLYRQKYMAGNLENVGYCKPDSPSIYNVDIMEEIAPIAAFGAGAISKWLYPTARRIVRAPNVKNIENYIARVDEMAQRKRALWKE